MPLLLNCSCGKQLCVPDEFAGKRIKCPACSEVLTVPEPAAAAYAGSGVMARPSPSSGAPAGGAVRFSCSCGKVMQARAEFAGRSTRCPACQSTLTIPGSGDAGQGIRAGLPVARQANFSDDYGDAVPSRGGRRRGKRKSPWLWVGLAAGMLLLLGGGIGAYFLFFSGKIAKDLALVPGDAQAVISLRAADAWKLDLTQKLIKEAPIPGGDPAAMLEEAAGVRPEDVERVTLVVMDLKDQSLSFAIVTGIKALNKEKLLDKLVKAGPVKETEYKGKKYKGTGATALFFVDERTLVMGEPKGVERFLDSQTAPKEATGSLRDALKAASSRNHVVAWGKAPAGGLPGGVGGGMGGPMMMMGALGGVGNLGDVKEGFVALDLGNPIGVEATVGFADGKKADAVRQTLDNLVKAARQKLPAAKANFAGQKEAQEWIEVAEKALNSLSISTSGASLRLSLKIDLNADTLAAFLKPMMNQAFMGQAAPFRKR